jgi:pyrimidine operon attenuation protein/uracil phosphoribosyltransferase
VPDPRANRLEDWDLERQGSSWFLKYRSSLDTSRHIVGALPRAKLVPVLERTERWPYRIRFDFAPPENLEDFLRLLKKAMVIARLPRAVDAAIALDLYQDFDNAGKKYYTSTGVLVRRVKGYERVGAADVEVAERMLCDRLSEVVIEHLWMVNATRILPVPGHDPGKVSASQRIGTRLARELSIPVAEVTLRNGRRKPAKNMTPVEREALLNGFEVHEDLDGEIVLIVDDFYQSGRTLAGVANAARRVGAKTALGLVAARNLSY